MKILKIVLFLIIIGVIFSCGENSKTNESNNAEISQKSKLKKSTSDENNEKIVANYQKVSLKIDGMTCEIGCARTIQSKLSKVNGVKLAEVNFEQKTGIVEFDTNQVSEKQLVEVVEGIAGGDLYEVKEVIKAE